MDIAMRTLLLMCLHFCSQVFAAIDGKTETSNDHYHDGKHRFTLNGVTVLEEPFIYSDSGKYRGFSVDIIAAIVSKLSSITKSRIDFNIRQPNDGQLGSIEKVDGIFIELVRGNADFAVGPISRNWFQNPSKSSNFGLNYTDPIIVSKLSALISRRSQENLFHDRFKQCQANMIRIYKDREDENLKVRPADLCKNNEPLTIEELFQNREIIKMVIQGSPVHQFFVKSKSHDWNIQDQLHLIHPDDMITAIHDVRDKFYVLLHETTLTHYHADRDCNFATIDQLPYDFYSEMKNVIFDSETNLPMALSWQSSSDDNSINHKVELKLFENELSIIINKKAERRYDIEFNRSLIKDFNLAISQLKTNGELNRLNRKHWAQYCRKNLYSSSNRITNNFFIILLLLFIPSLFTLQ